MPRIAWTVLVFLGATLSLVAQHSVDPANNRGSEFDANLTESIDLVMRSIATVTPGMTRSDLLQVFTTEGGLSNRRHQTFVYRKCPYIKVDVDFLPATNESDWITEMPEDKIVKISQPYLQWSVTD